MTIWPKIQKYTTKLLYTQYSIKNRGKCCVFRPACACVSIIEINKKHLKIMKKVYLVIRFWSNDTAQLNKSNQNVSSLNETYFFAIAWPMPLEPPVTMQTLFVNWNIFWQNFSYNLWQVFSSLFYFEFCFIFLTFSKIM